MMLTFISGVALLLCTELFKYMFGIVAFAASLAFVWDAFSVRIR